MSTIHDVKAAEKKVQNILDVLTKAGASDPENLRRGTMIVLDAPAAVEWFLQHLPGSTTSSVFIRTPKP
ncbi:MAG TPA: hypothetical protein VGS27_13140 [Candidatus Sulfotelmatobacter sp.]|nr:hypothetical protein [Candidatus Sulfotelmatobacter sp.]